MNESDDELLKRYRDLPRAAPPSSLDASILAASRRATRRPLARWAAPFSVAAVLVLALGLVLRVQREGPEVTLPSAQEQAMPGTGAGAPAATQASPQAAKKDVQPPAVEKAQAPKLERVTPSAPEPPASVAPASPSTADLAPAPAASRPHSARMAAAPSAAAKPELRELERIARLRAEGKDDEADAALEAFRRAHPDYRIEPAMWDKVRRH